MKSIPANKKSLRELSLKTYQDESRLVAPLAGFPGCDIVGCSIKVAQQNSDMHFKCIEAIKERFNPEISLLMMDLSVEANALGLPVKFPVNESSTVEKHPIQTADDIERLRKISILDDSRIRSYLDVTTKMAKRLDNLNCVYAAGPITLAGLLAGAEQVAIDSVMAPDKLAALIDFCSETISTYCRGFIDAGADIICLLEPTAVIFSADAFRQFSARKVEQISRMCSAKGVETAYHICGNCMHLIDDMASSGVTAISIDSPETGIDISKAAEKVGSDIIVIGNINPTAVMKESSPEQVEKQVKSLLDLMADYPNFILSTGCDLPPGTPLDNIDAFMAAGRTAT